MKTRLTALTLTAFLAGAALAQDKAAAPVDPVEVMKKIDAAAAPGPQHKALEPLIGEWDAVVKSWMEPGKPATMESKGTSKTQWILGGRFVQEEFHGELMGKPFNGGGLTGFDNQKQQYISLWIDDMNTRFFTSTGSTTDDGKTFNFDAKMDCPVTGEKDLPVKLVLRIESADKHVFEMHDPRLDENSKTMEITYTRK